TRFSRDWSSDVCSSDLTFGGFAVGLHWGIVGVAASFAIVKWPLTVLDTHFAARKVSVPTRDALWAAVYPALPLSLAIAGLTYLRSEERRVGKEGISWYV